MSLEENKKENIWGTVLRIVVTVLTALATSLGVVSCAQPF
ncbi:MAG: smalltalk protein [Bacteroidaceae bacterium]|nr:smalltalk protein [Bacteroidaceae bacterium]